MPAFVRCKTCGKDHPYREGIERTACENCGEPLSKENTQHFAVPCDRKLAKRIEGRDV